MGMTFQEIIDRAMQLATGIEGDDSASVLIDSEMTVEAIYPHALRAVIKDQAKKGLNVQDLMKTHSITFASGTAALPDDLLEEYLSSWTYPGRPFVSVVPYQDYQRHLLVQIDYLSLNAGALKFTPAGGTLDTFAGNVKITGISLPDAPVSSTTVIDLKDETLEDTIALIAAVLRGDIPLKDLIERYKT